MDGTPLVDVDPNKLLSVTITGIYRICILFIIFVYRKYIKYRLVSCQPSM